jgi:hypothetical protein
MAISVAVPRNGFVYVFGSKRQVTARIPLGPDKHDGLVSFTPSTVTIRRSGSLLVYGENGALVANLHSGS